MANVYQWICNDAPYIPENINTVHEQYVKNVIINQGDIRWHQYLSGLHSKIWNIAHIQWNIEAKQQNSTHLWNVNAIPAIIKLSISVWEERCTQIEKLRASAEHGTLLNKAKIYHMKYLTCRLYQHKVLTNYILQTVTSKSILTML